MPSLIHLTPGVLAQDQLADLVRDGSVSTHQFDPPEIGASALDLCLASKAWRLKIGQRPTTRALEKIQAQSDEISPINGEYFEFERGNIYLVKLAQQLKLPANVSGRATGKSSIGRLDVITRLITNGSREYDLVAAGYEGPLHLLLMPQTFTIRVKPGASLNQLRLFSGPHYSSIITREELYHYGTPFWWVLSGQSEYLYENWERPDANAPTEDPLLFDLTVDLSDRKFPYIFRAKSGIKDPIDVSLKNAIDPTKYFDKIPVDHEGPDRSVVLEQGSFYIMKSRERLHIPLDVAVEVVAISERIGDIRIHYAGFAHPGFGLGSRPVRNGTPLIFEVRATDMPTKLYDGSVLARIQLFRMSKITAVDKSDYDEQELKLSKVFTEWPSDAK
jgi:dCTP deaminase